MSAMKQATCEQRIDAVMDDTLADLKAMYRPWDCDNEELLDFLSDEGVEVDEDASDEDLSELTREQMYDYGLSFDYVAPGTFEDQREGYWRYQFSRGGPSSELRLYGDYQAGHNGLYRAEFWFLDWFDGSCRTLGGDELETADQIWADFDGMGMLEHTYTDAMEA
jgi:hypothetical protein